MHDSRFIKALRCVNQDRPPVWLMRQAGRYLPEYRALRERYSFLEMVHAPELIAQVTLMPIKRFGMDAAILFSDILVVLEAMRCGLRFEEKRGPVIERPVRSVADLKGLDQVDSLDYVAKGIQAVKPQLNVPLIGFCGAPFTVASYLVEGESSRDLARTKKWMYQDPAGFHQLLDRITEVTIDYLHLQIAAGVDAVQIFDSWANVLPHHQFEEFSLGYLKNLMAALKPSGIPVILFCRGSSVFAEDLAQLGPAAIGLDWNCSMAQKRLTLGPGVALQGNLDPHLLLAPIPVIEREVDRLLEEMQGDPGFILGLGHGVLPETLPEAVQALVERVKEAYANA